MHRDMLVCKIKTIILYISVDFIIMGVFQFVLHAKYKR